MRLARELINLPVISIVGGQELGKVKDLYVDDTLNGVTAISLGSEGLLSRTESLIRQADVITLGQDAILVRNTDSVLEENETPELGEWKQRWKRRNDLQGTEMSTPGGTKIGRLGDIILDEEANIAGFSLSQTFVSGPVADNRAVSRSAMVEPTDDQAEGTMTIELAEAERANLRIEHEGFYSEPTVTRTEESEMVEADA
jgi:uncharacterized protein YrrD